MNKNDIIWSDLLFDNVGNSLVLHVDEELRYEEAKIRCEISYDAQLVEFWNDKEWSEVK